MSERLCQRCGLEPAVNHELYCRKCRKMVIQELKDAGYLHGTPGIGFTRRGPEKRQAYDGDDSPWQQNAVRALEGD